MTWTTPKSSMSCAGTTTRSSLANALLLVTARPVTIDLGPAHPLSPLAATKPRKVDDSHDTREQQDRVDTPL